MIRKDGVACGTITFNLPEGFRWDPPGGVYQHVVPSVIRAHNQPKVNQ
jgi:hypothetical protein